jgi:periplasmic mercuric ion binding protein
MTVNGLVCAFCAQGIEKKLKKFPATAEVVVNLEHRLVAVALKDGQDISDADLRKALTDARYTVKTISRSDTPIADVRERMKQAQP